MPEWLKNLWKKVDKMNIKVPVLAGVILLKSEKMANYMNKNVPGILYQKYHRKNGSTTDKVSCA
jgi:5,10-methylenetetrahydrofolate reductase